MLSQILSAPIHRALPPSQPLQRTHDGERSSPNPLQDPAHQMDKGAVRAAAWKYYNLRKRADKEKLHSKYWRWQRRRRAYLVVASRSTVSKGRSWSRSVHVAGKSCVAVTLESDMTLTSRAVIDTLRQLSQILGWARQPQRSPWAAG